ncbi:hypothetical protein HK102_013427 [Quaeritorhiza haematococci]|nr:hypothetical protein HK102_013427 [Quaeritorhiza haematococci]
MDTHTPPPTPTITSILSAVTAAATASLNSASSILTATATGTTVVINPTTAPNGTIPIDFPPEVTLPTTPGPNLASSPVVIGAIVGSVIVLQVFIAVLICAVCRGGEQSDAEAIESRYESSRSDPQIMSVLPPYEPGVTPPPAYASDESSSRAGGRGGSDGEISGRSMRSNLSNNGRSDEGSPTQSLTAYSVSEMYYEVVIEKGSGGSGGGSGGGSPVPPELPKPPPEPGGDS